MQAVHRTTINLPSLLIKTAKRRALEENLSLTQLIIEGLYQRLKTPIKTKGLSSFLSQNAPKNILSPKERTKKYQQYLKNKHG